ncbi:MAG: hypothetical protein U1A78_05170 [Polyangia bacterium]
MADRYIDYDETQIYGPEAGRQIRKRVVKLLPKFDAALGYVADELDDATAQVGKLLGSTRGHDAARRAGSRQKAPLLAEALDVLGRFSRHLDTHKAGLDRKVFFPDGGTKTALGSSAPRVLLALSRIADLLEQKDSPVREAKAWHKEVSAAAAALAPAVAHSDSARSSRREVTPALVQAREAWLQVYAAAKSTVEAVLRLTGKLQLLPTLFPDLAVSEGGGDEPAPAPAPAGGGPEPAPAVAPPSKKKPAARTRTR